jgi:heterodisulfide reductase subunit A-like polyferredoxin
MVMNLMNNMKIIIDEKKCAGCGQCIKVCQWGVLAIENGVCKRVNEEACRMDRICIAVCKNKAPSLVNG